MTKIYNSFGRKRDEIYVLSPKIVNSIHCEYFSYMHTTKVKIKYFSRSNPTKFQTAKNICTACIYLIPLPGEGYDTRSMFKLV